MRTLDTAQLKSLMRTFKENLVFIAQDEEWFISGYSDELDREEFERIDLSKEAIELVNAWTIGCVISASQTSIYPMNKVGVIYDAWRSEEAYGRQPESGYQMATKHDIQLNSDHHNGEYKDMLCLDCAKITHYTEKREADDESCECGGMFSAGEWEYYAIAQLRAGKRLKADTGLSVDIPLNWTTGNGYKIK